MTRESENTALFVGVTQNPPMIAVELPGDGSWFLDLSTDQLFHGGEPTEFSMNVTRGDSITVEYNTLTKTLSFGKNEEELRKAFDEVEVEGKELYPVVLFPIAPAKVYIYNVMCSVCACVFIDYVNAARDIVGIVYRKNGVGF